MIHIDDFSNPDSVRHSGVDQIDSYYNKCFNYEVLLGQLLDPIRKLKHQSTRLILLDLDTDRYTVEKDYNITENSIVLLEGVFLFRKEILPFLDYKIHIDIPTELMIPRALERDTSSDRETLIRKYTDRYIPT